MIPGIWHDIKFTLRRIILVGTKDMKPRVRAFFSWDGSPEMGNLFAWKGGGGYSMLAWRLWNLSWHPGQKLRLVRYTISQTGIIFRLTLLELGHLQPKTLIYCNNTTAVGFANNSIKRQCSHSMEMGFFWVGDKISQNIYDLSWHPGAEKSGRLPEKTPPGVPPRQCLTVIFTHGKFSQVLTLGSETKHFERVCWNIEGWICM